MIHLRSVSRKPCIVVIIFRFMSEYDTFVTLVVVGNGCIKSFNTTFSMINSAVNKKAS